MIIYKGWFIHDLFMEISVHQCLLIHSRRQPYRATLRVSDHLNYDKHMGLDNKYKFESKNVIFFLSISLNIYVLGGHNISFS